MKIKLIVAISAILISSAAFAQTFEIFADYSYMQFNPTITGLNSRAYNGGGGGFQANMGKYFGIKGDFQGYGGTEWKVNVTTPITTSAGTIPAGTYTTDANMFTWMFGPVINLPAGKTRFFAETLFGGSNTSGYANLVSSTGTAVKNPNQHPFTMAVGGGIDVNLNKRVALRLGEFNWILTRYTNPWTNTNNQNSFRYLGGFVFKFGGE